jgi:hypothetical protein
MIPNCLGCQIEKEMIEEYTQQGLYFAGKGLSEKGHLVMIMVNNKGEVIIS